MGPLYMAEYPWLIGDISPHVYCNCSLLGPALLSPNNFCSPIFESPRNGGNSPAVPRWSLCVTKDIKNATATIPCNSKNFTLNKVGS